MTCTQCHWEFCYLCGVDYATCQCLLMPFGNGKWSFLNKPGLLILLGLAYCGAYMGIILTAISLCFVISLKVYDKYGLIAGLLYFPLSVLVFVLLGIPVTLLAGPIFLMGYGVASMINRKERLERAINKLK